MIREDNSFFVNYFVSVIIVLSLGFNFILVESFKIYSSHVLILFFFFFTMMFLFLNNKLLIQPKLFFGILLFLAYSMFFGINSDGIRFQLDFLKTAYFLFSIYFFNIIFINSQVSLKQVFLCILLGITFSTLTSVDLGDFGGYANIANRDPSRLNADLIGGINTYAVLLSIGIIIGVYFFDMTESKIKKIFYILLIGYLSFWLLTTLSRGGIVTLITGIVTYCVYSNATRLLLSATAILLIAVLSVIQYFDLWLIFSDRFLDLQSILSGSGRIQLWSNLLRDFSEKPVAIIFGFGIGSIDSSVTGAVTVVQAAHNMYLEIFYTSGAFVMILFLFLIFHSFINAKKIKTLKERSLMISLLSVFAIMNFTDSHVMASQLAWFFAMIISLPCLALNSFKREQS